ncbi:MAG: DUF4259 domain-containing protein [Candidatus Methylacidiphilales bacterium]
MGAWDVTIFGNDDAVDWTYEFVEEEDNKLSFVSFTLDEVFDTPEDEYIEIEQASYALAAADVLARLKGQFYDRNEYTEQVDKWVAKHPMAPGKTLVSKALKTIDRVLGPESELNELWKETDDYAAWCSELEKLKIRLSG